MSGTSQKISAKVHIHIGWILPLGILWIWPPDSSETLGSRQTTDKPRSSMRHKRSSGSIATLSYSVLNHMHLIDFHCIWCLWSFNAHAEPKSSQIVFLSKLKKAEFDSELRNLILAVHCFPMLALAQTVYGYFGFVNLRLPVPIRDILCAAGFAWNSQNFASTLHGAHWRALHLHVLLLLAGLDKVETLGGIKTYHAPLLSHRTLYLFYSFTFRSFQPLPVNAWGEGLLKQRTLSRLPPNKSFLSIVVLFFSLEAPTFPSLQAAQSWSCCMAKKAAAWL